MVFPDDVRENLLSGAGDCESLGTLLFLLDDTRCHRNQRQKDDRQRGELNFKNS